MKATKIDGVNGAINIKWRDKELVRSFTVVDGVEGSRVVDCRIYCGRSRNSSMVYCLLWTYPISDFLEVCNQGHGSAGGGNYDKESASVGEAIRDAGFELSERIDGAGEGAIRSALEAIARELGSTRPIIVASYA